MKGIYIMGGYPSMEDFSQCFSAAADAGMDFIEAGIPFNDPVADGPVISAAGAESIASEATPSMIIEDISRLRLLNVKKYVMTYSNIIYAYGPEKFSQETAGLLDGVIIADLPNRMAPVMRAMGLMVPVVPFATLETRPEDIELINSSSSEIVYFVGLRGITGSAADFGADEMRKKIEFLKKETSKKIIIGFGIKTPSDASAALSLGHGFVVGTEAVKRQKDIDAFKSYVQSIGSV